MASVVRWLCVALVAGLAVGRTAGAQEGTGTLTGRVSDSTSRNPIGSVTVSVVGTRLGAITREDGSYTIALVPAGTQRVRVTRIGYQAREQDVMITAGGATTLNLALNVVATQLRGEVIVGYGSQRREAVTGSVSTVKAEEANVGVIANANQLMQGRVAGVQMTTNNGEPGGGTQMRIRGGTSLSASNDPLYVVDGVPLQNEEAVAGGVGVGGANPALGRNPLNSINPNDIESITVLKDASATAIYGSRGANGVVLIQTKKGRSGISSIEYETYASAATPARTLDFLSASEYRSFIQQQVTAGRLTQGALDNLGDADTDWQDEVLRTGYAQNHNLAFSGGSNTTQYRASLNYFNQQGVVISNGLKRYQARLNGQTQGFNGRVNLNLNLTASRVDNDYAPFENGGGFEGGLFTNVAQFNPTNPVRDASGRYFELGPGAQSQRNPVALAEQLQDESPENRVLSNATATIAVLPGLLSSQTTVGVDYTNAVRRSYFPVASALGALENGLARQAQRSLQNLNFQQLLTFTPTLGEASDIEVVGGYEFTEFDNSGFDATARGFITDAFTYNNLGGGTQTRSSQGSYLTESRLVSFFSRANYGFRDRYFLTGVLRYDGSSRLAEGNQWQLFPALSGSWRVSSEPFWSQPLGLSTLAVRVGYGVQGNQSISPYQTQLLLRASEGARYPFGTSEGVTTGLVASQVANPTLKWETAKQTNLGVDFGLASNRVTGVLDIYTKTTEDLLLTVPVAQPAVVSERLENVGSLRNRGVELSLDAELFESNTRSFSSGLVLAVERNKIISLGDTSRKFIGTGNVFGEGQSGRLSQRLMLGEPIGTFWGPTFTRVNAEGQQLFRCSAARTDCVDGETRTPTADDESVLGNANPDFTIGFRSNGRWNRFDASWLWRAEVGREVFNNTALVFGSKGQANNNRNFLASALDETDALNESAKFSSRYIESGSFLRLQNITMGYSFELPSRLGGSSARAVRVYLSGDNLVLFTPYSGVDPEVFVAAGLASRGVDYLQYPRPRTFTAGTRIQF